METSKLTTDDIISETVYIVVRMSDREFPIYFHYLIKSPPAIWRIGRNHFINLENYYIFVVIYSKSILYKIHVASKKQIRNKTVFFDNSVFFSFHLISFFALGNI